MASYNVELPESEIMLTSGEKNYSRISIEPQTNVIKNSGKDRKESLGEFIKNLGSITSLPTHMKKTFSSNNGIFHQCIAAFSVLVLTIGVGHPIGFSAVLLPQLYIENSTLQVDQEMGSWVASIHSASSPIGSLMAGPIMERWGRKTTIELSIPSIVLGWIAITFAPNIPVLLFGRILCGYGVGYVAAVLMVYLGEISDSHLRGMILGTPFVSYSIGILIVYYLGALEWRMIAGISIILPAISYFLIFKLPESPIWLVRHGKLTRAQSAFMWLRGEESLAKRELYQTLTASAKDRDESINKKSFFQLIKDPASYKPLIIILVFILLQLLSGTYIVIFYAVDIIKEVAENSFDPLSAATYTAIVRLVFAVIGCFLLYHMNRRILCFISGIGSSVASITLAIFIMVRKGETSTNLDFWVTVACIFIYIASNTIGFLMMPNLMVGELLPAKIRGMCGGYIFMIFNLILFIFTKLYPMIKAHCGIHGLFLIFGISSLVGTIFMFLVLPETKNKSLIQIENYFKVSNIFWNKNKMNT